MDTILESPAPSTEACDGDLTPAQADRLAQLEPIIEHGMTSFVEVGNALLEIRDRRLYRQTHSSFEDYCRDKWQMSARHAYRLCTSAEVIKSLPEKCDQLVTTESQVRELAKIEPERRVEVLEVAASTGKVTAKSIKEVAAQTATPFKCDTCEETCEDETMAQPLYECGDCGDKFTSENSADGCGHSCPSCNKFGRKVSDMGCPSCGEGELHHAEPEPDEKPAVVAHTEVMPKAHVAHNSGDNEWYTPERYIEAALEVMGSIDLDPASCELANRTVKAAEIFTEQDNGLTKAWVGNVWMNPPYAQPLIAQFAEKITAEVECGSVKQACVLVNNATETAWFQRMMERASAVCFPAGRVRFLDQDGKTGAPLQGQAVIYFGENRFAFLKTFKQFGFVL